MADKDVRLIIRAKNQATKEIKSVNDAMEALSKSTKDAASQSAKSSNIFSRLSSEFAKLGGQQKAFDALSKVSGFMATAAKSAENLRNEASRLRGALAENANAAKAAGDNTAKLRSDMDSLRETYRKQVADATKAKEAFNRESAAKRELTAANRALAAANALSERNVERPQRIETAQAEVNRAKTAYESLVAAQAELAAKAAKTREQIKALDSAISESERGFNKLANEGQKLASALERSEGELARGEAALTELRQAAQTAGQSLGVVVTAEGKLENETRTVTPEVNKLGVALAALARFSKGMGQFTDPGTAAKFQQQRQAVEQAEEAWKALESVVQNYAREIREADGPTDALAASMKEAVAASRAAKAEYQAQIAALAKLQGTATSTFAAFAQATAPLDKTNKAIRENVASTDQLTSAMARYATGVGTFASGDIAERMRRQAQAMEEARQRATLLTAEAARLAAAIRNSGNASQEQVAKFRQVAAAANAAQQEFKETSAALQQMNAAGRGGSFFTGINEGGRTTLSLYQRIRGEVLSLAAAYGGLYAAISGVGSSLAAVQTMEAAQNRLGAVFEQNGEKTRNELLWLERQAQRLGIQFGTLADQYGKFAVAANEANFSNENTRKIFLAVAEAGRVNKLSLEDMNGVFLALQQMISKGRISSEELRQQLGERLPGAVQIMARALGKTTEELAEMMEQGEVVASQENLLKFADQLNSRFGPQLQQSLQSTNASIGRFFDNLFQSSLRFAEGGFLESFNAALSDLNEWLSSRDGRDFFLSLGAAAGRVVDVLGLIPQNIDLITFAIQALVATKLAGFLVGIVQNLNTMVGAARATAAANAGLAISNRTLGGSFTGMRAAIAANAAALATNVRSLTAARVGAVALTGANTALRGSVSLLTIGFRALWAAVGGWVGLIASAVAFLATSLIGDWLGGVEDATQALDNHKQIMQGILTEYEAVGGAAKDWAHILRGMTLDQLEANARKLREQFANVKDELVGMDSSPIRTLLGGWGDTYDQIARLRQGLAQGKISAAQFRKALEELYASQRNDSAKAYIEEMLETARKAEELETSIAQAADAVDKKRQSVDGLRGTLSDIPSALESVASAAAETAQEFDNGKLSANEYRDALNEIKGMIPGLADQMRELKELSDLQAIFGGVGFNNITGEMAAAGREAVRGIRDKYTNFEAQYTAERGTPRGAEMERLISATTALAEKMGLSAKDLLTAMSYETAGTFDPWKKGPTTQWGQHRGLIQWGEPQRQKYGVTADSSIEDQIKAVGKYLEDAGVKAGDGLLQIYAAINAGNAKKIHASDANNGGAPGTVLDKVQGQMSGHEARAEALLKTYGGIVEQVKERTKAEEEAATKAQQAAARTAATMADNEFQIRQQELKNQGLERQAAIEQAVRQAKAEDANISQMEIDRIAYQTGLLYDKQQVLTAEEQKKKEIAAHDERINALEQQRNALLQQRKIYEEAGDKQGLLDTDAQLAGVNAKLQEAIAASIAFHEALGGEKAAATVAQLRAMQVEIANANTQGQQFAMTASQMSDSIYNTLESGIINMFDSFAQAVANGENAVDALWTAFRQFAANFLLQIAQMIIKQTLFNALQSFSKSLGGGLFNFLSFHSGGVVGASGVGSGKRAISPAWFNNAVRYHTGGIAGLAPDEVPAVLKQGEEVLTETDARHRNNMGKAAAQGGKSPKIVNLFDAASFISEALNTAVGEEAILNHVRANPTAWRQAINS